MRWSPTNGYVRWRASSCDRRVAAVVAGLGRRVHVEQDVVGWPAWNPAADNKKSSVFAGHRQVP
jgi:hypothetical protein